MIGNDIVDLHFAQQQSNWRRKGWLQKIFTLEEQKYISAAAYPEAMVWHLWSRKEAAYKAHQRCFRIAPKYNPIAFQCDEKYGVTIDNIKYQTQTSTTSAYIHSIAQSETSMQQDMNSHQIIRGDNATAIFIAQMAAYYNMDITNISVHKDQNNIPQLHIKNQVSSRSFSLSHHGQYAAYAFI